MRSIAPRRLTGAACSMAKLRALALERNGRGPCAMAVARSLPRNSSPGRFIIAVFIYLFFFVLGLCGRLSGISKPCTKHALLKRRLELEHVKRMMVSCPGRERMGAANVAVGEM